MPLRRLALFLTLAVAVCATDWTSGQRRKRRSRPSAAPTKRREKMPARRRNVRGIVPPSNAYKRGASEADVHLDFVDTGFKWPQPNGPGSSITITYSYSNLLSGQLRGLTPEQTKQATEEALGLWAAAAPIDFVEVTDTGPAPTQNDADYPTGSHADIRIGYHTIDGASGPVLAHAFLPFSADEGLAGDLHLDRDEDWSAAQGGLLLETILHELGHSLGLDHEERADAIMNPVIGNRFNGLGSGFLLADDIAGIRAIYGTGIGSVTPLTNNAPPTEPSPPAEPDPPSGLTANFDRSSNTLAISGSSEGDSITIFAAPLFTIVYGTNGTRVNDMPFHAFFTWDKINVDCAMGNGPDAVTCIGLRVRRFLCDLGSGDDWLVLLFGSVRELDIEGGEGNDLLLRIGSRALTVCDSGFETSFR